MTTYGLDAAIARLDASIQALIAQTVRAEIGNGPAVANELAVFQRLHDTQALTIAAQRDVIRDLEERLAAQKGVATKLRAELAAAVPT